MKLCQYCHGEPENVGPIDANGICGFCSSLMPPRSKKIVVDNLLVSVSLLHVMNTDNKTVALGPKTYTPTPKQLAAINRYRRLKQIEKRTKDRLEVLNATLRDWFAANAIVSVSTVDGPRKILSVTNGVQSRIDTKALREAHPAIADEFTKATPTVTVRLH